MLFIFIAFQRSCNQPECILNIQYEWNGCILCDWWATEKNSSSWWSFYSKLNEKQSNVFALVMVNFYRDIFILQAISHRPVIYYLCKAYDYLPVLCRHCSYTSMLVTSQWTCRICAAAATPHLFIFWIMCTSGGADLFWQWISMQKAPSANHLCISYTSPTLFHFSSSSPTPPFTLRSLLSIKIGYTQ